MPTPVISIAEPGNSSAATAGKAAEDGSPGIARSAAMSSGWPRTVMRLPPSFVGDDATLAPKCRIRFSVWSRVGRFSMTVVSPGALSPASRIADFTCADGTGSA